ncbi:hypothetical protein FQR65_LT17040 [Abscondita terminalis]|nr:hypothetical protein FQR65_LT17040 [Abscondita terminalis]
MFAEVDAAHFGVVHDLLGRALGQHMAVADDESMVADAQRLTHVVVGDQHADAARLEKADDALDLDHGDGVDAGKGLVQQDEARLRGQGARNLDAAALAARQRQRRRCAQMVHAQFLQQRREALLDDVARQRPALLVPLQLQHGAHVVLDAELAEDRGLLRQIGQSQARALVDGHAAHGLAVDEDLAAIAAHQAHDHVERGGLARAVGTQQAHDLAFFHGQGHILDHLAAAIGFPQVAHLQAAPVAACSQAAVKNNRLEEDWPTPVETLVYIRTWSFIDQNPSCTSVRTPNYWGIFVDDDYLSWCLSLIIRTTE